MDFALLGPLEARRRGRRLDIGGRKQRVILAHLLIHANRVVSSDRLIDDVWGEEPPDAARKSIHAYVSRLRRLLADGARIEGRAPGYALVVDPQRIDAVRFRSSLDEARRLRAARPEAARDLFEEALRLWRGPALDDLADETSLQPEIARLEEQRLAALEERIEVDLALGREAALTGELEALAREHPLRERLWALLMLALYRAGRQGEALAAFVRARSVLSDELGVEPSPELQRLQAQILAQDPALAADRGTLRGYALRERVGAGTVGTVHRAVQPHVGRDVALKVIHPQIARVPDFVRRFETDAQAVARLEHPHVVPLYDYWRGPEGAFLVTRWLRGGSLRARLERDRLQAPDVSRIAEQVGSALAAAHRAGRVHGRVTTGNILLDEEGDAYLGDFSIGSLPPQDGSPRSDQLSLAAVLSQLVGRMTGSGDGSGGPVAAVIARAMAPGTSAPYPDIPSFVRAFRAALGELVVTDEKSQASANPYKGLRAFQEADHAEFFGRHALVAQLLARMADTGPASRFVAVVGASGSGKSSAVRAGLLPALRRGGAPGSDRWFVAEMYPGSSAFRELDEALLRVAVDPPATFMNELTADPGGLLEAVDRSLPPDGSELLLVIDQLEELYTLAADDSLRTRFLDSLVTALTEPGSRLRVVATLRADFYDRPLGHGGFGRLLGDRTVAVVSLSADELSQAILHPAKQSGADVEPELVTTLVADVADQPGALPLLQYALTELFEHRIAGRMSLSTYRSFGGISGAVARRANELYRELPEVGRNAARQLFLRLVALGEGTEDTRRRVPLGELYGMEVDRRALQAAIDVFGRHRLLSFDRDPATREPTVEVAHEALLRAWDRLRSWIEEARDDLRAQRRLAMAAAGWEASGRDPSDLWRGARLEQAEAWAAGGTLALTDAERAFMVASGEARRLELEAEEARRRNELELERRSVRRLRALAAVLGAGVFVAAALGGFALAERARAEQSALEARVRELAAAAGDQLSQDPELSVLLALEAVAATYERDRTVLREAEEALHRAIQASRIVRTLPSGGAAFFSPDGTMLAIGGERDAIVIDVASGEELHRLSGHEEAVFNAVFSPSGELLVTNGFDLTTRVWDLQGDTALHAIEVEGTGLVSVAVSPDEELLATSVQGEETSAVQLRDLQSGELIRELEAIDPLGINFNHDGSLIAAADSVAGLLVWEVSGGDLVLEIPSEPFGYTDVAFSPDGKLVVAGGNDKQATVWTLDGGVAARLLGHAGNVEGIAFSPDGSRIATGSTDGTARVWEAATGRPLLTLTGHDSAVVNVDFNASGELLATGSSDGTARLWDVRSQGSREWLTITSHPFAIDVSLGDNGRLVATSGFDGAARIFDGVTGDERHSLLGHEAPVRRIGLSPDGTMAVTASFDGTARVWEVETGRQLLTITREAGVGQAAFSPDGSRLAVADESGRVSIWTIPDGRPLLDFEAAETIVSDLSWSADGARLATSSFDGSVAVWDPSSGEQLRAFDGHRGPEVFHAVLQVDISSDGMLVASASWDGTARIWDVGSGEERGRLQGHGGEVWAVDLSPDGTQVATGAADGTARIWDIATGRELLTLAGHTATVTAVEFSSDGRRLATASEDQTVRIHALAIEDLVELARQRVTRQLTDDECRQYLHLESCPFEETVATRRP